MKRYTQEMISILNADCSVDDKATQLGISVGAVYKARSRLRKGQLIAWDGRMRKPLPPPTERDIGGAIAFNAARLAERVYAWAIRATVVVGVIDGRVIVAEQHTLTADRIAADPGLHVGTYYGREATRKTIAEDIREHLTPAGERSLTRIIAARKLRTAARGGVALPLRGSALRPAHQSQGAGV